MLENYYHHDILQKIIAGFGTLFDNIYVARKNSSEEEVQRFKVPIEYGPKQKFIRRIDSANPELINQVSVAIPKIGYETTSIVYDSSRKLNSIQNYAVVADTNTSLKRRLERVPYIVAFKLHVCCKNTSDAFQIIEQIMPTFTPEYVIRYRLMGIDNTVEVPITLEGINFEEDYEGDFETRKIFTATLSFTAKVHLFGPIRTAKVIKRVDVNFFDKYNVRTGQLYGAQGSVVGQDFSYLGATGITLETLIIGATSGATAGTDFGITGTYSDLIIY